MLAKSFSVPISSLKPGGYVTIQSPITRTLCADLEFSLHGGNRRLAGTRAPDLYRVTLRNLPVAVHVLSVGEMDEPLPSQVRIRIAFSGVNPGDVKKRQDSFWRRNAISARRSAQRWFGHC